MEEQMVRAPLFPHQLKWLYTSGAPNIYISNHEWRQGDMKWKDWIMKWHEEGGGVVVENVGGKMLG